MKPTAGRLIKIGLLALIATIGFDLFLHAGVLTSFYSGSSPFLLSPEESFRRIPIGYLSFVLLTVLLVWLMQKTGTKGWRRGFIFGLATGALIWGAETLGLYSITTANPALLLGWFLGQSLEMGISGLVIGSGLGTSRLRPLTVRVIVFFLITLVLSVILQNVTTLTSF